MVSFMWKIKLFESDFTIDEVRVVVYFFTPKIHQGLVIGNLYSNIEKLCGITNIVDIKLFVY